MKLSISNELQSVQKKSYYNSLLLSLFLSADIIIKIVNTLLPVQNFLVFFYFSIFMGSLLLQRFRFNKRYIVSYLAIASLFAFSILRIGLNSYNLQYFIYFSTFYFSSITLQQKIDIPRVFKYINRLNVVYALYLFLVVIPMYNSGSLNPDFTMNLSYTTLIGITAYTLSFGINNYKQTKLFLFLNTLSVLLGAYFMVTISNNRGALIALTILIVMAIIRRSKSLFTKSVSIVTFGLIANYIFQNFYEIIVNLLNVLSRFGLYSNNLSRLINSMVTDDIGSGRGRLYQNALQYFNESPLFGNGIGHFASLNNGQYPHNLILEVMTDLGFFFAVATVIFILFIVVKILLSSNTSSNTLLFFLFILSVPQLMLSSSLWLLPFFWSLIVFIITKKNTKEVA